MTFQYISKSHPKWKEWKRLANIMMENTNKAIDDLKNELKRMDGRVIEKDYPPQTSDYYEMYSFNTALAQQKALAGIEEDSSSDTCSSAEHDD